MGAEGVGVNADEKVYKGLCRESKKNGRRN